MADQVVANPAEAKIMVSAEEYMEKYAAHFYEWVDGELVKMSPASMTHHYLSMYIYALIETYLNLNPIGRVLMAPFVMKISDSSPRREPDLQVILHGNPGKLTETAMLGAADICIEIVSEESVERDHGTKFEEYEKGGVLEYWNIDPIHKEARFYQLGQKKQYIPVKPDAGDQYHSPLLPRLKLHVPTLWESPLPDMIQVVQSVQAMLG